MLAELESKDYTVKKVKKTITNKKYNKQKRNKYQNKTKRILKERGKEGVKKNDRK